MQKLYLEIDWAELDLYGHVNNVAYYRYMQAARINFCESMGLTATNEKGKLSFILAASSCNYLKKLFYPGKIIVETSVVAINNSSFKLRHSIFNDKSEMAAFGEETLVLYNYEANVKVSISEKLRGLMSQHFQISGEKHL